MGVLVRLIKLMNEALAVTSIVVSHDIHETLQIADYVYILSSGKVVGRGTPDDLAVTSNQWVRQFMQALPDGPVHFHYPGLGVEEDLMR